MSPARAPSAWQSAYSTFANKGQQNDPYSVEKVKRSGVVIHKHEAKPKTAFSPAIASNVTDVLRFASWTTPGYRHQGPHPGPRGGRTGTTDDNMSAWFVGYTAQLATAIDMYRFDDDETKKDREFLPMYGTGDQPDDPRFVVPLADLAGVHDGCREGHAARGLPEAGEAGGRRARLRRWRQEPDADPDGHPDAHRVDDADDDSPGHPDDDSPGDADQDAEAGQDDL
ncbi:hypothetical protein STANM309S_05552 [Streptomyces tanashiensis]